MIILKLLILWAFFNIIMVVFMVIRHKIIAMKPMVAMII
jgi:hypothetical protein